MNNITPLPWAVRTITRPTDADNDAADVICDSVGWQGHIMAKCQVVRADGGDVFAENSCADMSYIVRSCNAYPKLVQACRAMKAVLSAGADRVVGGGQQPENTLGACLDALSLAEAALAEAEKDWANNR